MPAAAGVARSAILVPSLALAASESAPSGGPARANASPSAFADASALADLEKALYLVAIAALMALLAFTVWSEFRAALRPGAH